MVRHLIIFAVHHEWLQSVETNKKCHVFSAFQQTGKTPIRVNLSPSFHVQKSCNTNLAARSNPWNPKSRNTGLIQPCASGYRPSQLQNRRKHFRIPLASQLPTFMSQYATVPGTCSRDSARRTKLGIEMLFLAQGTVLKGHSSDGNIWKFTGSFAKNHTFRKTPMTAKPLSSIIASSKLVNLVEFQCTKCS